MGTDLTRHAVELDIDQVLEALPHDHTALQLGQAIYRCRSLPWQDRWRAARELLVYESPRLGISAVINEGSFAELLERRLQRISEAKLIEAKPNNGGEKVAPEVEVKPPLPRLADRRYRRI
jgi:hypothetical protein